MNLREFITASIRPSGETTMLSKSKVYIAELGPYWAKIKKDVIESGSEISITEFKRDWNANYEKGEVEYKNIMWADINDYVVRAIHEDSDKNTFIKIQHGWAPVLTSMKLGDLVHFLHPYRKKVSEEVGFVFIYPYSKDYGIRF